ncbi:MAG: phosphatidylglycerol lysyltransferase domain-containing protein [Patescibacteria group bacterium]
MRLHGKKSKGQVMIPIYPQFKDISIDDFQDIAKKLAPYHPTICELNPANLIIWQEFDQPKITMINNNLCILICAINDDCFFLEPIGKNETMATIDTCLKHCHKMSRLSEQFVSQLPADKYKLKELSDQNDYTYKVKDLAELKGRNFDGKRNHINSFKKRHPNYEYANLLKSDQQAAYTLFDQWFGPKKETILVPQVAYSAQKSALLNAFKYFSELKLSGAKITIEEKPIGFILGSQLNQNTFNAHFQYSDPEYKGTSQVLLWEACNKTIGHYERVNLEQDLGIAGLRKAKLSYYPDKIEKKFEIIL